MLHLAKRGFPNFEFYTLDACLIAYDITSGRCVKRLIEISLIYYRLLHSSYFIPMNIIIQHINFFKYAIILCNKNNFFFTHRKLKLFSKIETKCNTSVHVVPRYQIVFVFYVHLKFYAHLNRLFRPWCKMEFYNCLKINVF